MGDNERNVEERLELLGTVALLTVTAVMKVIDTHHPQLTDEQRAKLGQVRTDVTRAVEAIDAHLETAEPSDEDVDLTGLRERLTSILAALASTVDTTVPPS